MSSIYGLTDPRTGEVRYIGKANDPAKRLRGHLRDARRRRTPVYDWIRKLTSAGEAPGLTVLEADCADWRESERRLIAEARGRGDRLLNVADGGDEPACPPEVRQANGRRVAEARAASPGVDGYWRMLRQAGQIIRTWRKKGQHAKAARLEGAVATLRSFTAAQRETAGLAWNARGHA